MKKDYILIIDSGIGGLSTLAEIIKILPANYIYYADNKHAPYGSHSATEIFNFLSEILNKEKSKKISLVVFACNTATTTCIEKMRKTYKGITFIGTEPAINLACKNHDKVLVISTPATAKQKKTKFLIQKSQKNVKILPLPTLARSVDDFVMQKSYFSYAEIIKNCYKTAKSAQNYEAIVLGCTHYCFLYDIFRKITHIPIYDGNIGVAQQTKRMANILNINPSKNSSIQFKFTKPENRLGENYKKILGQILAKM